jgi:hypothetical protein
VFWLKGECLLQLFAAPDLLLREIPKVPVEALSHSEERVVLAPKTALCIQVGDDGLKR